MADTRLEPVVLSDDERRALENWVKRQTLLIPKIRDVVGLYLNRRGRGGVQRGRETAGPSAGAHRAGAPDAARGARAAQLRLRAARHHRRARRPEHRHRQGHQQPSAQHTAIDFRDFLDVDQIDQAVEPGLEVHVICDNLSTHKAPAVRRWLLAHPPRAALHAHLLLLVNQVERWFAEIQRRCLDRGVFCSLEDLTTALQEWIKLWNDSARPFKWTKTSDQIIYSIYRYCDRTSRPAY
jgi:hypothetical protein